MGTKLAGNGHSPFGSRCDIFGGGGNSGGAIAAWSNEANFVAFFARQSDFSCSGWDEREPVFNLPIPGTAITSD